MRSWSRGNKFAWNIVVFGVDNSLLKHSESYKNNFLVYGERRNDANNVRESEKSLVSILLNQKQICVYVCIIMVIIAIYM